MKSSRIEQGKLEADFYALGLRPGDTVLVRASLGNIGRVTGGAETFINALLNTVGPDGTIVSLAFTAGTFLKKPNKKDAFDRMTKSYAGALPNAMLSRSDSLRSKHPMCSYVAIGRHAQDFTENHDENSQAYEPIRTLIELDGKCMLVGCVGTSPGFTTTHLAEADLGMSSLPIFSKLYTTYYKASDGTIKRFRRPDLGLCSHSFYKFYALYVRHEILTTGYIGNAYSIIAPAQRSYDIDLDALRKDRKMNICGSPTCFMCNAGRWDRLYKAPAYLCRRLLKGWSSK